MRLDQRRRFDLLHQEQGRMFSAKDRKDFAYAMLLGFMSFLQWVNQYDHAGSESVPEEDARDVRVTSKM